MAVSGTPPPKSEAAQYSGRFALAYKTVVPVVGALSLAWTLFFAAHGNWILAASQVGVVLVAGFSMLMAARGYTKVALLVAQVIFLFSTALLCLAFDVPSASVPRVSHHFMLVLALVGYMNFKRQPSRAQMAIVVASLVSFVVLASSDYALPFASPIPDEVRLYGAWINTIIATLVLVVCVYVFQLELERTDRQARDLQQALWNRQFELFYQPQVGRDGTLVGAEALLRWKHPKRGYVSPAEFIPKAEEAGLMSDIGQWVLETACQTLAEWAKHPHTRHLTLSVNVSASQFHDEDFEHIVVHLLDRFHVDPTRLKLEVTESVMMTNTEVVAGKMQILRSMGIGLALDDFGTGYSSLAYLRRLPLTQLKIDRSFVKEVMDSERSAALARSIVQLGRDLDLTVLAEGVETAEQFAFLRDSGCQEFQGFYFGRPVPLMDFHTELRRQAA